MTGWRAWKKSKWARLQFVVEEEGRVVKMVRYQIVMMMETGSRWWPLSLIVCSKALRVMSSSQA